MFYVFNVCFVKGFTFAWLILYCVYRYVSRIIVHDWAQAKKYLFVCKTWLSTSVRGGSLDKTFTTATHSEALSFHNLFTINSLRSVNYYYYYYHDSLLTQSSVDSSLIYRFNSLKVLIFSRHFDYTVSQKASHLYFFRITL